MKKTVQILYIVLFLIVISVGTVMNLPGLAGIISDVVKNNSYEAWTILIGLEYNDSFAGKYKFINLNGYLRNIFGHRTMNDVVKLDCGKLVSVTENFEVWQQAENTVDLYRFLQEKDIPFTYIQAPYEVCKYDPQLPIGIQDHSNKGADIFLEYISSEGIPTIDLREILHEDLQVAGKNHYDAFFSTDHHWKIETAFWAYSYIVDYLEEVLEIEIDEKYTDIDSYQIETLEDCMLGSNGRLSSFTFGGVDDLTLIYPKYKTEVSYAAPTEGIYREGDFQEAYMDYAWLEGDNLYDMAQYNVYIGEDWGYTQQKCETAPCDKKLLLIKDSYFRPVQAFLGTVFTEIETIDMRAFDGDVKNYIKESNPDMVLICYNPFMLQSVENFKFSE